MLPEGAGEVLGSMLIKGVGTQLLTATWIQELVLAAMRLLVTMKKLAMPMPVRLAEMGMLSR